MSLLTTAAERDHDEDSTRGRWWWMLLGGIVAGQLFAFWLVCSHQVRKAEARHNEAVIEQMAMSDCLQYVPGSTIASCNSRMVPQAQRAPADDPAMTGAVPVSFSYR